MAKRSKQKRVRQKIVLFIVEGNSDRRALERPIAEFIERSPGGERYRVLFCMDESRENCTGGDMTTVYGASPEGLEAVLNHRCIMLSMGRHNYMPSDLYRIIMITDTDGAYIDDADVRPFAPGTEEEHAVYTPEGILSADPDSIRDRNRRKSENLDFLSREMHNSKIRVFKGENTNVLKPFSIYYFSCNLEHFLHGEQNMPWQYKYGAADDFASEYMDDLDGFAGRLDDPAIAGMTYGESWDYIRQGRNSLQPHTNLGLLLHEIANGEL